MAAPFIHGKSPENVAVVINDDSADSQRIATVSRWAKSFSSRATSRFRPWRLRGFWRWSSPPGWRRRRGCSAPFVRASQLPPVSRASTADVSSALWRMASDGVSW